MDAGDVWVFVTVDWLAELSVACLVVVMVVAKGKNLVDSLVASLVVKMVASKRVWKVGLMVDVTVDW